MGADYYMSEDQRAATRAAGSVPLGIGENCTITNAIIDKNACIGNVSVCVCVCVCARARCAVCTLRQPCVARQRTSPAQLLLQFMLWPCLPFCLHASTVCMRLGQGKTWPHTQEVYTCIHIKKSHIHVIYADSTCHERSQYALNTFLCMCAC